MILARCQWQKADDEVVEGFQGKVLGCKEEERMHSKLLFNPIWAG